MTNSPASRALGLVGGLGVGAAMFYYRELVAAHLSLGLAPRLLMAHADVRYVMERAAKRESKQLAEYLAGLLRQLASGGCEIATIPAFSPQVCAAELEEISPLPLVSLLDAISAEVARRKFSRVALFGARVTMETNLFGKLPETCVVASQSEETELIAQVYQRIVDSASATEEDHRTLRDLAHLLIERDRLDAIVLAGTDLAFVFNPSNTDFPSIDGARVHVAEIMKQVAPTSAT